MQVKPNLLDRFILSLAPRAGFARLQARLSAENLGRKYEGASKTDRNKGWMTVDNSINSEIRVALHILRQRIRDLYQNDPYVKKAVQAIVNKTVGPGIRPAFDMGEAQEVETALKKKWKSWTESCDFHDELDFYGLQRLIIRTVAMQGEALIIRKTERSGPHRLKLQVLGGEHVDTNKTTVRNGGNYVINGVEYTEKGKKVAIWIHLTLQSEIAVFKDITSTRVPIERIVHVYFKEFTGQSRGVPFGTSSIIKSRDFNEYEDAELVRQKIAACFAVFVHDIADNAVPGQGQNTESEYEKVAPGIIEHLPPGKTITAAQPPINNSYHHFSRTVLQGSAAGFGVAYESMSGDYSSATFSSARMASIEMQQTMAQMQADVMVPAIRKVFAWFLQYYQLETTSMVGQFDELTVTWTPPRREFVDPQKELKALGESLKYGLGSWSEAVRGMGMNPEDVLQEIIRERQAFDEAGLVIAADAKHDAGRSTDNDPDSDPDGDGGSQQNANGGEKKTEE